MGDTYTEDQILNIVVNGVDRVEASARAFLGVDDASNKAKADIYGFAEAAGSAAKASYDLANTVRVVSAAEQAAADAALAETVARRQQANAAAGAAREEQHLADLIRAGAADERAATAASVQLAAAHDRLGSAAGGAGNKMAGLGQAGLQTGRILQDFTQGGVGGIINNLEGFAMAAGAGPGVAGALTLVGVAALIATPAVKAWYAEMTGGNVEIPKAADGLRRLDDELQKVTKRLNDYRDKQRLTNVELVEYNQLSQRQLNLEKEKNAEAERRQVLKGIEEGVPQERQERAAGFKAAAAEVYDPVGQLQQAIENLNPEMSRADAVAKAEELMVDAAKGFKDSIEEIRATIRVGLGERDQKFADEIQSRTPEARKGREAAEARRKIADEDARKAEAAEKEFWDAVRDQNREEAAALGRNVKELLDDVGEELKAAAEKAAKEGKTKEQVAAVVTPAARRAAEGVEFEGVVGAESPDEVAAAAAERVADAATDSRARARRERKAAADAKADDAKAGKDVAAAAKDVAAAAKDVAAGPLDELAAEFAARLRAQGGEEDKAGRVRPLTPEQQLDRVAGELQKAILKLNPGADPATAAAVARKIAEEETAKNEMGVQARLPGVAQAFPGATEAQARQFAAIQQAEAARMEAARALQSPFRPGARPKAAPKGKAIKPRRQVREVAAPKPAPGRQAQRPGPVVPARGPARAAADLARPPGLAPAGAARPPVPVAPAPVEPGVPAPVAPVPAPNSAAPAGGQDRQGAEGADAPPVGGRRRLRVVLPPGLGAATGKKSAGQRLTDRIAAARARAAAKRERRQEGIADAKARPIRTTPPTPTIGPGSRQVGSGATQAARNAERDRLIAEADRQQQARAGAGQKAVDAARTQQDAITAANRAKAGEAMEKAKAEQDARTAARNAQQRAMVDRWQGTPGPAGPMMASPRPAAPSSPAPPAVPDLGPAFGARPSRLGAPPLPDQAAAVLDSAGKGVVNTEKAIRAINMLAAVQDQQGRRLDEAMSLIPGGSRARTAAPRGRG